MAPVRGSPQRIRVADGQVLAFEHWLHYVNQQTSVSREALGAVWAAAVLQHRSLVIHGQVRRIRQRHLVTVYLQQKPSLSMVWKICQKMGYDYCILGYEVVCFGG